MNLKTFKLKKILNLYLMLNTQFLYTECPFQTLLITGSDIFKYTSLYYFFMATKVNWSIFYKLKKS